MSVRPRQSTGSNRYSSWKKSRAIFAGWMASCSRHWTRTPPSSTKNWTRSARWARRFTVSLASRRWRGARSSIPCAIRAKQLHPLKYLAGLARAIEAKGGLLCARTTVQTVEERGGEVVVKTDHGSLTGTAAVVATNSPVVDAVALHTKMAPYRTYAMATRIRRGTLPDALYWDTLDPYHYVRVQPGDRQTDFVIVGGADHKTGEANDAGVRFEALEVSARNLIPKLDEVSHRWSGQVLDTIDYAAFIGRNPGNERVYVHTGDSGQGMTHGVVGSLLNSALILQRGEVGRCL